MNEQPESKPDVKHISYRVTGGSRRQLRLLAIEHDTSMQKIIDDALSEYFDKNGLPPFEVLP